MGFFDNEEDEELEDEEDEEYYDIFENKDDE